MVCSRRGRYGRGGRILALLPKPVLPSVSPSVTWPMESTVKQLADNMLSSSLGQDQSVLLEATKVHQDLTVNVHASASEAGWGGSRS